MNIIKKFFQGMVYSVFPKICIYCKTSLEYDKQHPLCNKCFSDIKFITSLICQKCGLPLYDGGAHCYNCKSKERKYYFKHIRGAVEYKEPIKTIIHEFKYNNKTYLKNILSSVLVKGFESVHKNMANNIDLVCCVPISRWKRFQRGYNQTELLSEEFVKKYNFMFIPDLLTRRKHTVSQFKLSREQRIKNVKDIFNVKYQDKVVGKNILIIDDVCTTGETINQCAKALKHSKSGDVFGFTVARDV